MSVMTRSEVETIVAAARAMGERPDLAGANLRDTNLKRANLTGADLTAAKLQRANLTDANLEHARLQGVNLTDANLESADLTNANLSEVNMVNVIATRANFTATNLTNANLTDARMFNTTIEGATFTGVIIKRMMSGDLQGLPHALPANSFLVNGYILHPDVKLTGADLSNANLADINLTDVTFVGTHLPPSVFSNATVTDEQLLGAKWGPTQANWKRISAMRNAATTKDVTEMKKYIRSTTIGIRVITAGNIHCPNELLLTLATDPRQEVRAAVVNNPSCSAAVAAIAALQT